MGPLTGLTIPQPTILYVPAKVVEGSPSLVIRLFSSTLKCSHGLAFGSRVISGDQVFDYLPESIFESVENRQEFIGLYALDKWLCNCDGRQAVFCRREQTGTSALITAVGVDDIGGICFIPCGLHVHGSV
jgi:hypothetical protein